MQAALLESYRTVGQAARRLRVHPETVKRLCRDGSLPAQKFHNTWLIHRDALEVFAMTYDPRRGPKRAVAS